MRTWERSPRRLVCGRCLGAIQIGDLMYVLKRSEWRKFRCASCADVPAPTDIPPLATREHCGIQPTALTPKPPPPFARLGRVAEDWKAKQSEGGK